MALDAYIKFGEGTEAGPNGKLLPAIEGDSTDDQHYWWCELRGYDFALEAAERNASAEGDTEAEKPKPSFKKVTIRKRVDWASTQLFMKCCHAAEAMTKKTDDDQDQGQIDRVTIEICKQSGDNFPFLIVRYFSVRIVGYSIDMAGPEPSETLSFVFEKLDLEYQETDAFTGKKKGATAKAIGMENYEHTQQAAGSAGGGSAGATAGPGSAVAAAAGGAGGGAGGSNGSAGAASPSTEAIVTATFPGVWTGTGFGVLPD